MQACRTGVSNGAPVPRWPSAVRAADAGHAKDPPDADSAQDDVRGVDSSIRRGGDSPPVVVDGPGRTVLSEPTLEA